MVSIQPSPDGYQRPHLAVYCLLFAGAKLLMLRRTGTKYASGFWSVPAGHVDENESLLAAASREMEEETGLEVRPEAWSLVTLMHRRASERTVIDVFVKASHFTGTLVNREPTKHADLAFYEPSNLNGQMIPYVEAVVGRFAGGQMPEVLLGYGW